MRWYSKAPSPTRWQFYTQGTCLPRFIVLDDCRKTRLYLPPLARQSQKFNVHQNNVLLQLHHKFEHRPTSNFEDICPASRLLPISQTWRDAVNLWRLLFHGWEIKLDWRILSPLCAKNGVNGTFEQTLKFRRWSMPKFTPTCAHNVASAGRTPAQLTTSM